MSEPSNSSTNSSLALARLSPAMLGLATIPGFRVPRHLAILDRCCRLLAARKIRRLMVHMPPRHGKSWLLSRMLPAWWLGAFPTSSVILASYGAALSSLNSAWARDTLAAYGTAIFGPGAAASGSGLRVGAVTQARLTRAGEWQTAAGGICKAVGVRTGVTGRGGDLIVIDDPVKDAEEAHSQEIREKNVQWYRETLRTRLEPHGAILYVATPWHMEDLGAKILEEAEKGKGPPWHVIRLPALARHGDPLGRAPGEALWPKRIPREDLLETKEEVGTYTWSAQYDCEPKPDTTNEFPVAAFERERFFTEWPRGDGLRIIAVDPSMGKDARKGDPSAIVKLVLVGGMWWVEGDVEVRPAAKIVTDLLAHIATFKPHGVAFETNVYQELLKDVVMSKAKDLDMPPPPIFGINNLSKKDLRIRRLEPAIAAMRVMWRETKGTRVLTKQLQEFPQADHDDGPDALEMAQRLLMHMWKGTKL